jgi:hypothetical protein
MGEGRMGLELGGQRLLRRLVARFECSAPRRLKPTKEVQQMQFLDMQFIYLEAMVCWPVGWVNNHDLDMEGVGA